MIDYTEEDALRLERHLHDADNAARDLKGTLALLSDDVNVEMHELDNQDRDAEISEEKLRHLASGFRLVSVGALWVADQLEKSAERTRKQLLAGAGAN